MITISIIEKYLNGLRFIIKWSFWFKSVFGHTRTYLTDEYFIYRSKTEIALVIKSSFMIGQIFYAWAPPDNTTLTTSFSYTSMTRWKIHYFRSKSPSIFGYFSLRTSFNFETSSRRGLIVPSTWPWYDLDSQFSSNCTVILSVTDFVRWKLSVGLRSPLALSTHPSSCSKILFLWTKCIALNLHCRDSTAFSGFCFWHLKICRWYR